MRSEAAAPPLTEAEQAGLRIGARLAQGPIPDGVRSAAARHASGQASGLSRPAPADMAPAIAADFRSGRTLPIGGVSFSETEAGWFLFLWQSRTEATA